MARKTSPPSYCHHKASGQAYTRINGKMIYLGDYDSKESRTEVPHKFLASARSKIHSLNSLFHNDY